MTTHKDWLPFNHEALYDQATQTFNYLTGGRGENRTRMRFATGTAQNEFIKFIKL
jgi:hypothetical protein